MLDRPDWCISRQRAWGVPIPLLIHKETRELHPDTNQLIEDIDESRPIYFAVTVSPTNRMGLEKYLEMEGLVYKITNTKPKLLSEPPSHS